MAIDPSNLSIHDEMVVETEIDGVSIGLPAFITNILAEELWLATRLPDPRLAGLAQGQPVHLAFGVGGGLIVESVFLRRLGNNSKLGMEKSRVFAVRRPQGIDTVQRRAHARVDLERTVRIKALGSLGTEQMGNGKTINIGAGGVQFLTNMPLLFGEQLRIALVLTSRDIVVAGGVIVRIEDADPVPDAPGAEPGAAETSKFSKVALRFDRVSEADQERITCHILAAHRQRVQPAGLPARVSRHGPLPAADPDSPADPPPTERTGA